jgi:hypothetical protein
MTRPDATCDWCHPPIAATSQRTICSTCLNAVNAGTYQPPTTPSVVLYRKFRIRPSRCAVGASLTTITRGRRPA